MTQIKNLLDWQKDVEINILGSREKERRGHSTCAFADRALYIIAGATRTLSVHNCQKSVYCFCIEQKEFSKAPNLNVKRFCHASCVHGGKIYTFGGWEGIINASINSIERLDVENNAEDWELFTIDDIRGVQFPVMSSLSQRKILIAGGAVTNSLGKWIEENREAYVIDEREMVVRKQHFSHDDFCNGRAVMIVPGKVIWIGPSAGGTDSVHLYDHNTKTFEAIHEF